MSKMKYISAKSEVRRQIKSVTDSGNAKLALELLELDARLCALQTLLFEALGKGSELRFWQVAAASLVNSYNNRVFDDKYKKSI